MKHAISVFRLTVPFVFHTKGYVMKKNISIKIPYSETAGIKSSLFKSMIAIAALLIPLVFASCTSSVELHANGDGSINILYDAAFDSAFIEIMQSCASHLRLTLLSVLRFACRKKEMTPYRGRAVFPDPLAVWRSRFLPHPVQNYTNSCPIRCSRISIYLWRPFFSEKLYPKTNTSI